MDRQPLTQTQSTSLRERTAHVLNAHVLPIGWLVIMTGMFWAWDRSLYHKLFYIFLAVPTLLALALQPGPFKALVKNPMFLAFAAFSAYILLSVSWAADGEDFGSLFKRPLYIAMVLLSAGLIALKVPARLAQLTHWGALIATSAAALSLIYFYGVQGSPLGSRLEGYGALYNPLLSAHVFGAFASVWLATWYIGRNPWNPLALGCLAVLGVTLIATGSRTPIIGMAAALLWLMAAGNKKRGGLAIAIALLAIAALYVVMPDMLTSRGASYRPEIWMESLRQIGENPWLGRGYDSEMTIVIPGLPYTLADPHIGGVAGLTLWLVLYGLAMRFCWMNRREPQVVLAATWLVFGFASGLTEGSAFMSRPKEHWFLIWIPMALVYAQWLCHWGNRLNRPT
jgi:O-antigen ligase